MKTFWMVVLCCVCFTLGSVSGFFASKQDPPPPLIVNEEIHLKIPKTPQDVKKQLLHLSAQKALLEEWIKWEEKGKKK